MNSEYKNSLIIVGLVLALDSLVFIQASASSFQRFGSIIVILGFLMVGVLARKAAVLNAEARALKDKTEVIVAKLDALAERKDLNGEAHEREFEIRGLLGRVSETAKRAKDVSFSLGFAELTLLVVGTVQWGYGDLIHCWLNGNGWKACG